MKHICNVLKIEFVLRCCFLLLSLQSLHRDIEIRATVYNKLKDALDCKEMGAVSWSSFFKLLC